MSKYNEALGKAIAGKGESWKRKESLVQMEFAKDLVGCLLSSTSDILNVFITQKELQIEAKERNIQKNLGLIDKRVKQSEEKINALIRTANETRLESIEANKNETDTTTYDLNIAKSENLFNCAVTAAEVREFQKSDFDDKDDIEDLHQNIADLRNDIIGDEDKKGLSEVKQDLIIADYSMKIIRNVSNGIFDALIKKRNYHVGDAAPNPLEAELMTNMAMHKEVDFEAIVEAKKKEQDVLRPSKLTKYLKEIEDGIKGVVEGDQLKDFSDKVNLFEELKADQIIGLSAKTKVTILVAASRLPSTTDGFSSKTKDNILKLTVNLKHNDIEGLPEDVMLNVLSLAGELNDDLLNKLSEETKKNISSFADIIGIGVLHNLGEAKLDILAKIGAFGEKIELAKKGDINV